jgi:hypothetical protein
MKSYASNTAAVMYIFDAARENTLQALLQWKQLLDTALNTAARSEPLPQILIANKGKQPSIVCANST